MTPTTTERVMRPESVLLLSVEDNMGVQTHKLLDEMPKERLRKAGEGVVVKGDYFTEDYRQMEELLMLFPAQPINGLSGTFVLTLAPAEPGFFSLRNPVIEAHDGEFIWQAEMMNDAPVSHSWSYTRRPQLRSLYLPLFDDPYENFASQVFHQVPLRTPYSPNLPRSQSGWETVEIPLSGPLVNQSAPIDLCEQLLEELDSAFNSGDGEYLHWQQKQVTPEAIDRLAKQVEEGDLLARGETFNITLNIQGQETTRNKRVRSVASYPITLYDSDGAPVTATLGCSLSN